MMYAIARVGDREMPARQWTRAQLLDSRTLSVHTTQNVSRCSSGQQQPQLVHTYTKKICKAKKKTKSHYVPWPNDTD